MKNAYACSHTRTHTHTTHNTHRRCGCSLTVWAMPGDGALAVKTQEVQYFQMTPNGDPLARTQITSAQYPEHVKTKLRNATHFLQFQTYNGIDYHCEPTEDDSLADVVLRRSARTLKEQMEVTKVLMRKHQRRALRAAEDGEIRNVEQIDENEESSQTKNLGFRSVLNANGTSVYCKYFTITIKVKDQEMVYHIWEDYQAKRIFQVMTGDLVQRFDSLQPIDDSNALPETAFNLTHVFLQCDPMDRIPPLEWREGHRSDIVVPDPMWGSLPVGAPPVTDDGRRRTERVPNFQTYAEQDAYLTALLRRGLRTVSRKNRYKPVETNDFRTFTKVETKEEFDRLGETNWIKMTVPEYREAKVNGSLPHHMEKVFGRRSNSLRNEQLVCTSMDESGKHGGIIYSIKIKSYCEVVTNPADGSNIEVPRQFHSLDFNLQMPGGHFRRSAHDEKQGNIMQVGNRRHAGCPKTTGEAWVRISENFDVTAYGKLEILFDVVDCFISAVSSVLSTLLKTLGAKIDAYLKIEGKIGLEGLDEKTCSSEECSRSALSTRIGSISKNNAFFKGEGRVSTRIESDIIGSFELRASLYFDLVGTLFCTGCRAATSTDQASFVGIHMDAEFYYSVTTTWTGSSSGTTLVNVFPEMWVDKPEECGRTKGLVGEDVYNFIESGSSGRQFGFYAYADNKPASDTGACWGRPGIDNLDPPANPPPGPPPPPPPPPMSYTISGTSCQTAFNGRYTYVQDANGRPAFKHDSKNYYIVYNSYYYSWYVSTSLSASTFNCKIVSSNDYPPSSGWYEWCIASYTGLGYPWYSPMRVRQN